MPATTTDPVAIPEAVRVWTLAGKAGNARAQNRYTTNSGYSLHCATNNRFLSYVKTRVGINLGYVSTAEEKKVHFRLPDGAEREILSGERIALAVGGDPEFLKYAEREFGINLEYSSKPAFEWRLYNADTKPGDPIPTGAPIAILNENVKPAADFLVHHDRPVGSDIRVDHEPELDHQGAHHGPDQVAGEEGRSGGARGGLNARCAGPARVSAGPTGKGQPRRSSHLMPQRPHASTLGPMANVRVFTEIDPPRDRALPDGRRWAPLLDFPQAMSPWPSSVIAELTNGALRALPQLLGGMPTPVESVTVADIDLEHRPLLDEDGAEPGAYVALQFEDDTRVVFLSTTRSETIWWWRETVAATE